MFEAFDESFSIRECHMLKLWELSRVEPRIKNDQTKDKGRNGGA